jgi:hypothetical protein
METPYWSHEARWYESAKRNKKHIPSIGVGDVRCDEHSPNGVGNGLIRTLGHAVLRRRASASRLGDVPVAIQKFLHIRVGARLTPEVHTDDATADQSGRRNPSQKKMQPREGEPFALRSNAKEHFRLEIIDNAVCIASVKTSKNFSASVILGALEHETNIEGKSLSQMCCNKRRIGTASSLLHLCNQTFGALFDLLRMPDAWHAF